MWKKVLLTSSVVWFLGAVAALGVVLTDLRVNGNVVSTGNPLPVTGTVVATPGAVGNGTAATAQRVTVANDSTGIIASTDTGNIASGATDSGNPVKVGGVYNTTPPTFTNGQRGDLQTSTRGSLNINVLGFNSTVGADVVSGATADSVSGSGGSVLTRTFNLFYNGATWDRFFTCASQTSATVTAAATTQLVAISGSTNIRVCSYQVGIATTGTYKFVSGTGSNCGTGTADLTPATNLTAGNVVTLSAANGSIFRAGASNALCLTAVTGNVQVFISYAQF